VLWCSSLILPTDKPGARSRVARPRGGGARLNQIDAARPQRTGVRSQERSGFMEREASHYAVAGYNNNK
jgi:hypothetical protein